MKPRLTLEDIKQKLEPYNIIVLDDEYKNAHQDIHMICSCGKPFQKTWNNMSKKVKQNKPIHCRECANRKISQDQWNKPKRNRQAYCPFGTQCSGNRYICVYA